MEVFQQQEALKRLGSHLRSIREAAGLSQEELGFRANLHRTYISEIELGQKNPTYITLLKLANSLSISIFDLIPQD